MINKRGQFYLIAAIILIGIMLGFATLSNSIKKQDISKFNFADKELQIEFQKILENAMKDNLGEEDILNKLDNFASNYSLYSNIESLYFIFGTTSTARISAYNRKNTEKILVEGQELNIPLKEYIKQDYSSINNPLTINIGGVEHEVNFNEGENFYYIINSKNNENEYIFIGNI